jgi:hypothetical protein
MVGVVNPGKGDSIEKQKQAAVVKAAFQLLPGQPWPAEDAQPSSAVANSTASHGSGLSSGTIAGIVLAVLLPIILAAAFFVFRFWQKREGNQAKEGEEKPMSDEQRPIISSPRPLVEARRHPVLTPLSSGIGSLGSPEASVIPLLKRPLVIPPPISTHPIYRSSLDQRNGGSNPPSPAPEPSLFSPRPQHNIRRYEFEEKTNGYSSYGNE